MPSDAMFEDVIDIVAEEYGICVQKARELFTEEQAIQSASATMFINATKEKSSVASYINALKDKIAKLNKEAIPSAIGVWQWHFREYVAEFGSRITGMIAFYVSENRTPEEIEYAIKDRVYRLRSAKLTPEEAEKLAEQMFGEDEHD